MIQAELNLWKVVQLTTELHHAMQMGNTELADRLSLNIKARLQEGMTLYKLYRVAVAKSQQN